jgi:hypothetical protein
MAKPVRVGAMASTAPSETRHRRLIRVLVVLATLLAFLAIFTSWIDRQALDTNEWVDTSGKLLEDKTISDAVATYAVDQLYSDVDVPRVIKKRLPPELQPVSAPIAAGIRQFATQAAKRAFQTPQVLQLWKDANRVAHTEFVSVLKGNNRYVSLSPNGTVTLELRPIIIKLAGQIGLQKQASENLPADVGQLEVAKYDQLGTARTIVRLIEGFAWFFTFGSLALFGIAMYLARGRRWVVVLGYGLGLIAAGLAAIAVRAALKGPFVDSLATTEVAKTPAQHVWDIGTSLLQSIASEIVLLGFLFVVAAWIASPHPSAVETRRALAPTLHNRPGLVWTGFAALATLSLIAFPPPGIRQLVLALVLIALAAIGVETLHRKTDREFPGAKRGDWMDAMRERARLASTRTGHRISAAMKGLTDEPERPPEDLRLDRLERLGELREKGILTKREFREEKRKVLQGSRP